MQRKLAASFLLVTFLCTVVAVAVPREQVEDGGRDAGERIDAGHACACQGIRNVVSAVVVWAVVATRFWGEYAPITRQVDPWLFMWGPWWTVDFYIRGVVVAALLVAHLGVSVWLDRRALSSLPSTPPQSG